MTTTSRQARILDRISIAVRYTAGFIVPAVAAIALLFVEDSASWVSSLLLIDSIIWRVSGIVAPRVHRMREAREAAPVADEEFYNYM